MLATPARRHRGPEVIEHVAVESDPLARLQPDDPHPDALVLGKQLSSDTGIGIACLALELRPDFRRPSRLLGMQRLLVRHAESHGIPPANRSRYITPRSPDKWREKAICATPLGAPW